MALLRWYGSPGFFDRFSMGFRSGDLLASQAHQHHGHLINFGAFGSVGRCQILLENEVSIFKKLVTISW